MSEKHAVGDVVVLLPGILGSVLQRDGKDVWALSKGALLKGVLSLGKSVRSLELPPDDDGGDLGDGIVASRLMPDAHLLPGFWKIDGYGKIKETMFDQFEFVDGLNWHDFPYDWRRDNRFAAARLAELAPGWLADYRAVPGNEDAKLILVGHSMGGLVARHFLEMLGGWEHTRALITFGTPYRGSLNALDFVANGFEQGFGPFTIDLSGLLRSLTSVHQLLPIYPCVDDGRDELVRVTEAQGLPDGVDAARVADARAFHTDIADAVERNGGAGRYHIVPVAGIFQPTKQSAVVRDGSVRLLRELGGHDLGGDGTVPRVSATPLELSDARREVYATESHGSLQNVDAVLTQLAGLLTWEPLGEYRKGPADGFRLDVDDVVAPTQPIDVGVATGGPVLHVAVTLENLDTGETTEQTARLVDGIANVTLPPVPVGIYRVEVRDDDGVGLQPTHDMITVVDDASAEQIVEQTEPTT